MANANTDDHDYDLNSSLPVHDIEDYDHTTTRSNQSPYDHLTETHITGAPTENGPNAQHQENNYRSFADNKNADHHMIDDDNKSMLSKLIDRSKLISEVLAATYGKPTSYVRYAAKEQNEGINDELASVLMQQEFDTGHRVKFGTWDGVCARCLLNIFGVIMYLRVGFIVAEAGIIESLYIIVVACTVTLITTLSMSALCTNGVVLGGGAYYFISRVMGPSVGGSVGLVFSVGNMFAVSLYIIGFAETLGQHIDNETGWSIFDKQNDIRIWSNVLLVATFILAVIGMSIVIKTQLFLLLLIMVSLVFFFIGSVYKTEPGIIFGIDGWTNGNFKTNLESHYDDDYDFWRVFAIFFPAVTGIMAGANISGDLKQPEKDIPKGTLWSIGISTVIYILLSVVVGAVVIRDAGDDKNGLKNDNLIMAKICSWDYLVLLGIYAATLSSAIEALVGAPRILQAVAYDLAKECFPYLGYFSKENRAGDPIRGYVLTCAVTFLCNLTGELNAVAEMISQFFMFTYAVMNFCIFWIEIGKRPSKKAWDPTFTFYNKWLSLIGGICSLASMFVMNYLYAGPAIFVTLLLYLWIEYKDPSTTYQPIKRFYLFQWITDCFICICCPFKCCKIKMKKLTRRKTMNMKFDLEMHNDETNTELIETNNH